MPPIAIAGTPSWALADGVDAPDAAALPPDIDAYDLMLINPRLPGLSGITGLARLRARTLGLYPEPA